MSFTAASTAPKDSYYTFIFDVKQNAKLHLGFHA